jgi:hypothetical protein
MTPENQQTPTDVLPNGPDEDVTVEMFMEAYKLTNHPTEDQWKLIRDRGNPAQHGGLWIAFNPEHHVWKIVETIQGSNYTTMEAIENDHPGFQYVREGRITPDDIIIEKDGTVTWTDDMDGYQSTLSSSHVYPSGTIVDNDLTDDIASWTAQETGVMTPIDTSLSDTETGVVVKDSYKDVLNHLGITPRSEDLNVV